MIKKREGVEPSLFLLLVKEFFVLNDELGVRFFGFI
jgi:hypothetical protein